MERSALYRRALAPTVGVVGLAGLLGGAVGMASGARTSVGFVLHWSLVACAAITAAFLVIRRQALTAGEPFWSPPARRVGTAMVPAFVAGAAVTAFCLHLGVADVVTLVLPGFWMLFFGCAIHSASFFMPRGMRLFGWGYVVVGGAWLLAGEVVSHMRSFPSDSVMAGHALMGFAFGLGHLAYAGYLYLTERNNAA